MTTQNSRLKRLPENSHTIILRFEDQSQRDECINNPEFIQTVGEIAALVRKYNSTFEIFAWDILSGTSIDIETQEIIS